MLKVSGPISYVLVGLFLALFLYSGFLNIKSFYQTYLPVETIFEASITVPDFFVGEDPVIQYSRQIHEQFRGLYYVEVKNATTGITSCRGNGSSMYTPNDANEPTVNLSWYLNENSCIKTLIPGRFIVETNYVIQRVDSPSKFYTTLSNVFRVSTPD